MNCKGPFESGSPDFTVRNAIVIPIGYASVQCDYWGIAAADYGLLRNLLCIVQCIVLRIGTDAEPLKVTNCDVLRWAPYA